MLTDWLKWGTEVKWFLLTFYGKHVVVTQFVPQNAWLISSESTCKDMKKSTVETHDLRCSCSALGQSSIDKLHQSVIFSFYGLFFLATEGSHFNRTLQDTQVVTRSSTGMHRFQLTEVKSLFRRWVRHNLSGVPDSLQYRDQVEEDLQLIRDLSTIRT